MLALLFAAALLASESLPRGARRSLAGSRQRFLAAAASLHSGHVGDYVTWFVVGVAVFGAAFAFTLG